jgi:hypothetical protein
MSAEPSKISDVSAEIVDKGDSPLYTRREAIERVSLLLGGIAFVGGDRVLAAVAEAHVQSAAASGAIGAFSALDVALLDDIADTILPETTTPGARAARTGAFMAVMVTDVYTVREQETFMKGLAELDAACRKVHGVPFAQASAAARLSLLETLDREQKAHMEARAAQPAARAPIPEAQPPNTPVHYFRMMKELALLGYFTSEMGYTRAMRYLESPGRYDPCAPYAPGEKIWANHA